MRPSPTVQVTTMELVTKDDPVLPILGASGVKPFSSDLPASTRTAAPTAGLAAPGWAPNPGSRMPASQNNTRMILINRIRTKHPGPETPRGLGPKPTLSRKPAKSAPSPPGFQGVFPPRARDRSNDPWISSVEKSVSKSQVNIGREHDPVVVNGTTQPRNARPRSSGELEPVELPAGWRGHHH